MFDDVMAIRAWLAADRDTPYAERLKRDRALGRRAIAGDEADRVFEWWRAAGTATGPRYGAALGLLTTVAGLVGLLLGISVALTAFNYDGEYPINIFAVLGLTVALPGLLLLPTLLAALPLGAGIEQGLLSLSPVRAGMAAIDQYLGLNLIAGRAAAAGREYARWFSIAASQWLAVAFFAGLLACILLMLIFTDLAFGWSSTVSLTTQGVVTFVQTLALPWASLAPGALPGTELIEQSRFVRMGTPPSSSSAAQLGNWWPFLFFSIAIYGLVPRLALLGFALWRRNASLRTLLLADPEVIGLLERMSHPLVTPEVRVPEAPTPADATAPVPEAPTRGTSAPGIVWNKATSEAAAGILAAQLGYTLTECTDAGSSITEIAIPVAERLLIMTKGWEPPLLEFHDFLAALRSASDAKLVVIPVNLDGTGIDSADAQVWSASIARADTGDVFVAGATL